MNYLNERLFTEILKATTFSQTLVQIRIVKIFAHFLLVNQICLFSLQKLNSHSRQQISGNQRVIFHMICNPQLKATEHFDSQNSNQKIKISRKQTFGVLEQCFYTFLCHSRSVLNFNAHFMNQTMMKLMISQIKFLTKKIRFLKKFF